MQMHVHHNYHYYGMETKGNQTFATIGVKLVMQPLGVEVLMLSDRQLRRSGRNDIQ